MRKSTKLWLSVAGVFLLLLVSVLVMLPSRTEIKFGERSWETRVLLGLDLQGGAHLVYRADVSGIGDMEVSDALAGVRDVIERRVNAFGVSEPVVQTNRVGDEYRVIVELAGVHDTQAAIEQIGETPQLDFRREVNPEEAVEQFNIDDPSQITGPVFERTDLTGKNLKRSTVGFDQVTGTPEVTLEFDDEGSQMFADLTKNNLQKRIAIYLDGVPISAPVVQSEITNGKAVISGGFTLPEAKQLAQRLNAGALPVPVELIGQQTVGPTLGRESIQQSIAAGVIGFLAVVVFMIVFYRAPGVVAGIALLLYVSMFIMLLKLLPITLTLAGVAGFILSIGMAVDANVLIFERFRENVRAGKSVGYALENGFTEAWSSIRDSNVSSLLTAIILYTFGTSIIRGFAVTFSIGIVLSMFTAIAVTKTLMELYLRWSKLQGAWLLSAKTTNKELN